MDFASLLIHFLSGIAGGNVVGALFWRFGLGALGNTLAGIVGGGLGGQILGSAFGTSRILASNGFDLGIVISEIASGGIGGVVLALLIGVVRQWLPK